MPTCHFITHPEVVIDPSTPVPDWSLSVEGVRRLRLALKQNWMSGIAALFSSTERKATDAARLIGEHLSVLPVAIAGLGENDRSATGYLPRVEFEMTADAFFSRPGESVRGWERAVDAQHRIVAAVERVIAEASPHGDIAIVSHGGVGGLLLCNLKRVPISRAEDQPGAGGGNVFSFDTGERTVLTGWRPIEG